MGADLTGDAAFGNDAQMQVITDSVAASMLAAFQAANLTISVRRLLTFHLHSHSLALTCPLALLSRANHALRTAPHHTMLIPRLPHRLPACSLCSSSFASAGLCSRLALRPGFYHSDSCFALNGATCTVTRTSPRSIAAATRQILLLTILARVFRRV